MDYRAKSTAIFAFILLILPVQPVQSGDAELRQQLKRELQELKNAVDRAGEVPDVTGGTGNDIPAKIDIPDPADLAPAQPGSNGEAARRSSAIERLEENQESERKRRIDDLLILQEQ